MRMFGHLLLELKKTLIFLKCSAHFFLFGHSLFMGTNDVGAIPYNRRMPT